jgi:hypothetical protein
MVVKVDDFGFVGHGLDSCLVRALGKPRLLVQGRCGCGTRENSNALDEVSTLHFVAHLDSPGVLHTPENILEASVQRAIVPALAKVRSIVVNNSWPSNVMVKRSPSTLSPSDTRSQTL